MSHGFSTQTLDVRTSDGLDDVLMTPLTYVDRRGNIYRAPEGGTTDGLSVPRCVQNIIPATGGDWFSGVLHDSAYRRQLTAMETQYPFAWLPANLTKAQADSLLLEAMASQRVGWLMRQTIYWAVRLFGGRAWRHGHK